MDRLREHDLPNRPNRPRPGGPEMDVNSDRYPGRPTHGVDDGLIPSGGPGNGIDDGLLPDKPKPGSEDEDKEPGVDDALIPRTPKPKPDHRPKPPPRGIFPSFIPRGEGHPDFNMYATKKTVAQGLMDLALLTANANQLRYVLESSGPIHTPHYYYISLTLIFISIILQLVVAPLLIVLGRYNIINEREGRKAALINDIVIVCVFFITVINVFISAFGIEQPEWAKAAIQQGQEIPKIP